MERVGGCGRAGGVWPLRSGPLGREGAGKRAEQGGLGTARREGEAHAACGFDDPCGDLDQAQAQRRKFRAGEVAGLGDGLAQGEHQPIGRRVQREPHLIGDRGAAGRAVGGELGLVQLDQVLGLAARAIERVVEPWGVPVSMLVTTKRMSSPSFVASMRATARRSRPHVPARWRAWV